MRKCKFDSMDEMIGDFLSSCLGQPVYYILLQQDLKHKFEQNIMLCV